MAKTVLREGQYLSISADTKAEVTIQRSRFIASLRFAASHDEFETKMKEIAAKYPKATHHCWAYRFIKGRTEHSSDAGEPAGTAGRPILGALKKYSLYNVMAVVTRYYGGIKLGVKGLIAAYGGVTLRALEDAEIITREPETVIEFRAAYNIYNILLARLEKYFVPPSSVKANFGEVISGEISIPDSLLPSLTNDLNSISQGMGDLMFHVKH